MSGAPDGPPTPSVAPPGTIGAGVPYLGIEQASTSLGDVTVVRLEQWPDGSIVTVMLCGNRARRGSQDCDLAGATVAEARPAQATFVRLPVQRPPVGCPCVIRATTQRADLTRTLPVDLPDVEWLTPEQEAALGPAPTATAALVAEPVTAEVGASIDPAPLVFLAVLLVAVGLVVLSLTGRRRPQVARRPTDTDPEANPR